MDSTLIPQQQHTIHNTQEGNTLEFLIASSCNFCINGKTRESSCTTYALAITVIQGCQKNAQQ